MWSVGSTVSDVYLGTRAFAVCDGAVRVVAEDARDADAALGAFGGWLADVPLKRRSGRRKLRVWLSGGLCRPFILPAVEGIAKESEAHAVAVSLAPRSTGLTGPCAVFLEQASALAVAAQEARVQQIHDLVSEAPQAPRLLSIRPWWAEVLRHSLLREPSLAVLAVQDCDSMTLLVGRERGRFDTATTYSPVLDLETAQALLARSLLSDEAAGGNELKARLALASEPHTGSATLAFGSLTEFSR